MKRHRLFNMHLTTTISVALVLFLIGLECVVLMSSRELVETLRENVTMTIVMQDEASVDDVERMHRLLNAAPYRLDYKYISREEALLDHIKNLGEDPSKFLGYNPLTDAFELRLKATYTMIDSVKMIDYQLSSLPYVNNVIYQEDVVNTLDRNLNEVSIVLLIIGLLLLIIALVLISNTIQLQIYSKRFIINTMRLVGATPWVIKWPFVRRNMLMGVEAAVIALGMLALTYYYCVSHLGIFLFSLTYTNVMFVLLTILLSGLTITCFASLAATSKYIRMKTNKLYEI